MTFAHSTVDICLHCLLYSWNARRECGTEVHSAVAAVLQGAAKQPGMAQALANCGMFWTLSRLLLRDDLPADHKARGSQVVA